MHGRGSERSHLARPDSVSTPRTLLPEHAVLQGCKTQIGNAVAIDVFSKQSGDVGFWGGNALSCCNGSVCAPKDLQLEGLSCQAWDAVDDVNPPVIPFKDRISGTPSLLQLFVSQRTHEQTRTFIHNAHAQPKSTTHATLRIMENPPIPRQTARETRHPERSEG